MQLITGRNAHINGDKKMLKKFFCVGTAQMLLVVAGAVSTSSALAVFPDKPIRLVVPLRPVVERI